MKASPLIDGASAPVIIIGSGPAGLTAAIYAARCGLQPIVIQGPLPGGQLMKTTFVENWPGTRKILGPELMISMLNHATDLGSILVSGKVSRLIPVGKHFEIVLESEKKLSCQAIIIATGAQPRLLNCPGQSDYWNRGVSSCAVCDGALFKDLPVVVIGGGNAALENALFMSNITKKVTIIHRGDELNASEKPLRDAAHNNPAISILYNTVVQSFNGNKEALTNVTIQNTETNQISTIDARAAFISIGSIPATDFLPQAVERLPSGHVIIHDGTSTTFPGIFAAGDVVDYRYRQAITSSAEGCKAALDVQNYLKKIA